MITTSAAAITSCRSSSSATRSKPGHQPTAERDERAGDAARRAGAVDLAHVDAVVVLIDLGESLQATGQQLDLRGRCALLRAEHLGGLEEASSHVAGNEQLHAAKTVRRM